MNITCSNEMDTTPYSVSVFTKPRVEYDVLTEIKRQKSREAQAYKNARKQRARELTRLRELEIKKAKGDNNADER